MRTRNAKSHAGFAPACTCLALRLMLLGTAWMFVSTLVLFAQPPGTVRIRGGDSIANRIRSQAALIEAQNNRELKFAEARKAHAEALSLMVDATSKGIDLELKMIDTYWKKKRRHHLEMWNSLEQGIENARMPMVKENARKLAVWERTIEGELERARPSIRSGELLNRVAAQIDQASSLSSSYTVTPAISQGLASIDAPSLKRLRLSVSSVSGPIRISLDSSLPPIFNRWPYLFRSPQLRDHCGQINALAAKLFSDQTSATQRYDLEQQANMLLERVTNAFYREFPPKTNPPRDLIAFRRFNEAEKFLSELKRTISTYAENGASNASSRPAYFDEYAEEERNAATLIQYVTRYGVKFEPSPSGSEHVYDRLFLQFRDLARQLNAAPVPSDISKPIINLDLDELLKDHKDPDLE